MADVNVTKKNDGHDQRESQSLTRRRDEPVSSRGDLIPSLWRNPAEILNMNPFSMMRRFTDEMDRAFSGWSGARTGETGMWSPAIEVSERDGQLRVHADLPGMNKDDVKIEVADGSLILQGERKHEQEEEKKGIYRSERTYGSFYRSIPLPEGAKLDEARAQFNNGVLEFSVPVPEQQQNRRQIPIETGAADRRDAKSETSGQKRESKAS